MGLMTDGRPWQASVGLVTTALPPSRVACEGPPWGLGASWAGLRAGAGGF